MAQKNNTNVHGMYCTRCEPNGLHDDLIKGFDRTRAWTNFVSVARSVAATMNEVARLPEAEGNDHYRQQRVLLHHSVHRLRRLLVAHPSLIGVGIHIFHTALSTQEHLTNASVDITTKMLLAPLEPSLL